MTVSLEARVRAKLEQYGYQAELGLEARVAAALKKSMASPPEEVSTFGKDPEPINHRLLCLGAGDVAVARKKTDADPHWKLKGSFKTAALALRFQFDSSGETLREDSEQIVVIRIKLAPSKEFLRDSPEKAARFSGKEYFARILGSFTYPKQGGVSPRLYRDKIVTAHPWYQSGDLLGLMQKDSKLSPVSRVLQERVIHVFSGQLLHALRTMESLGYVHRDIKAENVFLEKNPDDSFRLALGDLDFSCEIAGREFVGTMRGTPAYLPPEMLSQYAALSLPQNYRGTSEKGDVWAAGLVMREMCSLSRAPMPKTRGALREIIDRGSLWRDPVIGNTPFHWFIRLLLTVDAKKRPTATEAFSLFQNLPSPDFLKSLLDHALRSQNIVFIRSLLEKKPELITQIHPEQVCALLRSKNIPDKCIWDVYQMVHNIMEFDEFFQALSSSMRWGMTESAMKHRELDLFRQLLNKPLDKNAIGYAYQVRHAWEVANRHGCEEALNVLRPLFDELPPLSPIAVKSDRDYDPWP